MKELHKPGLGMETSEIASLNELAISIGLDYGQKWLNGKNTKVAYGNVAHLIIFLDSEVRNEEPQFVQVLNSKFHNSF